MERNTEKRVWGIHAKDEDLFLEKNVLAIGWNLGDLSRIEPTREAFKQSFLEQYPHETKNAVATRAGILYRFVCEMKDGDYVVYPSKSNRKINIGIVVGDYFFNPDEDFKNQRKVKWIKHLPRTDFTQGALYEVGSAMSFFMVKNYADEYIAALNGIKKSKEVFDDETVFATAESIEETTTDFILKELSRKFKGYPLESFVSDLLRAMGYRAEISAQGGDNGKDIIAYKDELPPRIVVQVKSQDGDVKESTLQSLKGAMREGDYGLFVTLSDYTKNAKKYLSDNPIIRGINGVELVGLILKYYDMLNEENRKSVPLKKVYIPIAVDNEGED